MVNAIPRLSPEFQKEVDGGYVSVRAHPELDLFILNYKPAAQFDRHWNDVTMQCRGLIVDADGHVIARPFRKFFNLSEHEQFEDLQPIPYGENFTVAEKLDGSLIIIFFYDGKWRTATRGSFTSEQALRAAEMLEGQHGHDLAKLDIELSYLCEVLYKENQIVVSYDKDELVLLGAIHTQSEKDCSQNDFSELSFRRPMVYKVDKIEELPDDLANFEGYVIQFESGLRVKVKLAEYIRLHKLVSDLTPKSIWDFLRDKKDVNAMIAELPDELYATAKLIVSELQASYDNLKNEYAKAYEGLGLDKYDTRKEQALAVLGHCRPRKLNPSILFEMLNDRKEKLDRLLWDEIKPKSAVTPV